MSDCTDDWPTFSEELSRKGMKVLDECMRRVDIGERTLRDLYLVTDALWDVMSGLAPEKDLRVLEQVHQEILAEAKRRKKERE